MNSVLIEPLPRVTPVYSTRSIPYFQSLTFTPEKYQLSIISDITQAKNIWNTFARDGILFENWEFMMTFYNEFHHKLKFYTAYENDTPVCLIPLNFDEDTGKLECFFSKKAQHPVYVKPGHEDAIDFLIQKIDGILNLEYIYFTNKSDWAPEGFEFQMGLYDLDITPFTSWDDYLSHINTSFPSKKRIKYNAEHRKVRDLITKINYNRVEDLETLFDFNIKSVTMEHYGEVSWFLSEGYKNWFRKLVQSSTFETHLLSFEIDGVIHDVELGLIYGDTFYHLTGCTSRGVQNLWKFANLTMIDLAIKKGCKIYNAGTWDYNWKEKLGLKKVDLYKLSVK